MPDGYDVPAPGTHRVEETIKRSRFIATTARAGTADAARAFIAAVREEFPDATHNCWAFAAGPPGDTAHVGMSDDGEPHGTAGRPMLTTLLHSGVGEAAVVVTRYFGGTKLGTGGLVRAYSGMVQAALDALPRERKVDARTLELAFGYPFVDQVKRLAAEHDALSVNEDYGAQAVFAVTLPEDRADALAAAVTDLTAGTARIREA